MSDLSFKKHLHYNCPLCGDLSHNLETSGIFRLYGTEALYSAVLWESPDLYLTPAPGCLTVGYFVLAPKQHCLSFSQLHRSAIAQTTRLWKCIREKGRMLNLSEYILFEHGAVSCCRRGAACVEHAHLHFVPTPDPASLRKYLSQMYSEKHLGGLLDLRKFASGPPYIYLETPEGCFLYETPIALSQLLRRKLAAQWGVPECWNWKTNPMSHNFWETINIFKKHLGGHS